MNLDNLSMKELVELFNTHSPKPTKRFPDRKTALARLAKVLPKAAQAYGALRHLKEHALNPAQKGKNKGKLHADILASLIAHDGDAEAVRAEFGHINRYVFAGHIRIAKGKLS